MQEHTVEDEGASVYWIISPALAVDRGPHTISPIVYDKVPNFMGDALPRTYAFVTDEAGGRADMKPCTSGVRSMAYMFDITSEKHPIPVSFWQVPVGNFCEKGGRFGPHQHSKDESKFPSPVEGPTDGNPDQ